MHIYRNEHSGPIKSITLTNPGEALLLDDGIVWHSVSPIMRSDHAHGEGPRDVFVVTFHAE